MLLSRQLFYFPARIYLSITSRNYNLLISKIFRFNIQLISSWEALQSYISTSNKILTINSSQNVNNKKLWKWMQLTTIWNTFMKPEATNLASKRKKEYLLFLHFLNSPFLEHCPIQHGTLCNGNQTSPPQKLNIL